MKRMVLVVLIIFLVSACSPTEPKESDIQTAIAQTKISSPPTQTLIPTETQIPTNTNTPKPTNTPLPTATIAPTLTLTPKPQPILLKGKGDSVVDVSKGDYAAIVHITNKGSSNFVVWNYGANGKKYDLLVNEIGNYDGTLLIDIDKDEWTTRFEIESKGEWTIELKHYADMRKEAIPGKISGKGCDVVAFIGKNPDLLKVDASKTKSNFVIYGIGSSKKLLVNEIGPYTGTKVLVSDTFILTIEAEGEWILEVTTK